MAEEKVITLSEFKTVVENFESKLKAVAEGVGYIQTKIDVEFHSLKEQIGLLHEGQTEIKGELKQKADRLELSKLEKRVARLEHKVA